MKDAQNSKTDLLYQLFAHACAAMFQKSVRNFVTNDGGQFVIMAVLHYSGEVHSGAHGPGNQEKAAPKPAYPIRDMSGTRIPDLNGVVKGGRSRGHDPGPCQPCGLAGGSGKVT
ncbi:hypothetical protein CCP4SC76_8010006 [Gammaproteobacteria bacterium]